MEYTYEYSPYTGQDGEEIPHFEINCEGVRVAETNEDLPCGEQERVALLFTHAEEMLGLLREVCPLYVTLEKVDTEWASKTLTLLNRFNDKEEKAPSNADLHLLVGLALALNNDPDNYDKARDLLNKI